MPAMRHAASPSRQQLRHFGWLVTLVVAVLARRAEGQGASFALEALAAGIFAFGTFWPQTMRWPHAGLTAATWPVRWLLSRVLLAVVYYGLITPLALIFRFTGRDALGLSFDPGADTYWQPRRPRIDPQPYFRQF
jgi:Saxitoxin biosynthesis operon protein SxtJ